MAGQNGTNLRLTPTAERCLERIMQKRFGPEATNKKSQTVVQLLLEECERIGVSVSGDNSTAARGAQSA